MHHPGQQRAAAAGVPGLFPALHSYPFAIGLALAVLAGAERNEALLDLALGYLTVVLVAATFGTVTGSWEFPVQLVTAGSVLLFGGIGFLLAQRPWRRPA